VSVPVTVGFGDGALSAMGRVGTGSLLCRGGELLRLEAPIVDWSEAQRGWRARAADAFDVALEPLGRSAAFADGSQEFLCKVSGEVGGTAIECLGHVALGDGSSSTDWRRTSLVREVSAWFHTDLSFAVHSRRPARADAHEAEALEAVVLRGSPPEPVPIEDPRLSTAYGEGWHQNRAGLELWETEESDHALRLAGQTIGEGELVLADGAILRSAFLIWRHDGLIGTGRYDIALPPER
jgi:hypothetical protein